MTHSFSKKILSLTVTAAALAAAISFAPAANAGTVENLERERAIAIETMLNPELKPEERHARVELFKRRLVDLARTLDADDDHERQQGGCELERNGHPTDDSGHTDEQFVE